MIAYPFCKINIGLFITSKRSDGFHNIATCFYPIKTLSDILEIVPASTFSFQQTGINIDGNSQDNLVVKAYKLLQKYHNCPMVNIHLHKCIPIGAGLGGGSSDAISTLLLLNEMFQLAISKQELEQYANDLGSDCAFFLQNSPAIGKERGNVLTPINLNHLAGLHLVLIKPNIHINTALAYKGCQPQACIEDIGNMLHLPIEQWQNILLNDFEKTLFPQFPILKQIKDTFINTGAIYASLSGSGATVFALYKNNPPQIKFEEDFFTFSTIL